MGDTSKLLCLLEQPWKSVQRIRYCLPVPIAVGFNHCGFRILLLGWEGISFRILGNIRGDGNRGTGKLIF
jgi:hypothetical protein